MTASGDLDLLDDFKQFLAEKTSKYNSVERDDGSLLIRDGLDWVRVTRTLDVHATQAWLSDEMTILLHEFVREQLHYAGLLAYFDLKQRFTHEVDNRKLVVENYCQEKVRTPRLTQIFELCLKELNGALPNEVGIVIADWFMQFLKNVGKVRKGVCAFALSPDLVVMEYKGSSQRDPYWTAFILAHELYHLHLNMNQKKQSETAANDFARRIANLFTNNEVT